MIQQTQRGLERLTGLCRAVVKLCSQGEKGVKTLTVAKATPTDKSKGRTWGNWEWTLGKCCLHSCHHITATKKHQFLESCNTLHAPPMLTQQLGQEALPNYIKQVYTQGWKSFKYSHDVYLQKKNQVSICSQCFLFVAHSFTLKSAKTYLNTATVSLLCAQQVLSTTEQQSYITLAPFIFQGFLKIECVF